jgi:hypothetical protein
MLRSLSQNGQSFQPSRKAHFFVVEHREPPTCRTTDISEIMMTRPKWDDQQPRPALQASLHLFVSAIGTPANLLFEDGHLELAIGSRSISCIRVCTPTAMHSSPRGEYQQAPRSMDVIVTTTR